MCFFEQKSVTDTSTTVKEEVGCRWKHYPAGKAARYETGKKQRTKALSSADPLASLRTAALRSSFFVALNRLAIVAFRYRSAIVYFLLSSMPILRFEMALRQGSIFAKVAH
jgi:hypothetical protein